MQDQQTPKFQLKLIAPYSTFVDGAPIPIPYLIDGLLPQGGFSALGAKPKQGKSSLARYEAVCVAKGIPFLGRETKKGEVILISLEDPRNQVDNCLSVLGWDDRTDATIHLVEKLAPTLEENIEAIRETLKKRPKVRLLIVDTLMKLLRVSDTNDYMPMLKGVEQLHNLAREFPCLHIQGICHCKKIQTDDPFDALLGSTALRGEPDTNIALYQQDGQRVIVTETRIGRNIPPTILEAEIVESAGADVVKNFNLSLGLEAWKKQRSEKSTQKKKLGYEDRVIQFLRTCEGCTATQETVLKEVEGRRENLCDAIKALTDAAVLSVTGVRQSSTNPLKLTLDVDALEMYDLGNGNFSKRIGTEPLFTLGDEPTTSMELHVQ